MVDVLFGHGSENICDSLANNDFWQSSNVKHASSGEEVLAVLTQHDFSLLVMETNLSDIEGFSLARRVREAGYSIPILVAVSHYDVWMRACAHRAGVDDLILNDISGECLNAFVEALTRFKRSVITRQNLGYAKIGRQSWEFASNKICDGTSEKLLTPKENQILQLLVSNRGKVVTREDLLDHVWNTNEDPLTNVIDVYVGRLRNKLGVDRKTIKTVRGTGYQLI